MAGRDVVARARVAFDGRRLGRRLECEQVAGGGALTGHRWRECSTGPRVDRRRPTGATLRSLPGGTAGTPHGGDAPTQRQSVKSQVMTVRPPTVAIPTPIRVKRGSRMFAMWFHCPG